MIGPFSPIGHIDGFTPTHPVFEGSVKRPAPDLGTKGFGGARMGLDKSGLVATGEDKMSSSGLLPGFIRNLTNSDRTALLLANLMTNSQVPIPLPTQNPQDLSEAALHRFWIGEKEPEEPRDLPPTPKFSMDVHEINKVEPPSSETDQGGGGAFYLPQETEDKTEEEKKEEKLEADEIKENIVVDEAFSWKGHVSEHHYSSEKLYTNSLAFISAMLPFRTPISHQ